MIVVGVFVGVFVGYCVGSSAVKKDYIEMKACYEHADEVRVDVYDITKGTEYKDEYDELTSAISEIDSLVAGKTAAFPKVFNQPEKGYYYCP